MGRTARVATPPGRQSARSPRVLPAAAVLTVAAGIALSVSPSLRHELGLSFARQPQPFVELYFADERVARTCPLDASGRLAVEVAVRSHLTDARTLGWRASATSGGTAEGSIATRPGRATSTTVAVAVSGDDYTVRVELTGRSEYLVLHCPPPG